MNDLEFIPTRELVTELLRRSDISAIVMNQDRTENTDHFILSYGGPVLGVVGLLELAKSRVLDCHKSGIHNSEVETVDLDPDDPTLLDEDNDDPIEGYEIP